MFAQNNDLVKSYIAIALSLKHSRLTTESGHKKPIAASQTEKDLKPSLDITGQDFVAFISSCGGNMI